MEGVLLRTQMVEGDGVYCNSGGGSEAGRAPFGLAFRLSAALRADILDRFKSG